nr:putative disease resistance protein rga4 [Quercus suber]
MAERVLSVVVDGVIANAMSLASEHISSVWGFKEEIEKLQVSLTKIQALLHDAEKKQLHDESVKIWLRQLKDVAYVADDVLDEYGYEILRQKVETQNQICFIFTDLHASGPLSLVPSNEENMAERVLSVVVDGVIANAMSLASEHISSVWGFKEEIEKLQVSLTKIQALLHDAEKKQLHDESVKIWLRQLKDVAYVADDVLDEYGYEILRQKVETQNQVRSFFSSSNPVVFRVKMAKRIKTINESLDEIKKDIPVLGLIASLNPIPQTGLDRETDSFIDGSEVVGRGDDVLKIVKLMIGANNQQVISVIPIVEGETLHLEGNLGDDIDVSHTRRLSLISDGHTTPAIPLSEDGMGRLRTVFLNWVDLGDKLLEFKCVRGLSLSGKCIKELPESIEKPKVHKLEFFWSWWDEREGNNNDEDVLEGFQPHPNLKSLEIKYFKGEKFPSWLLGSDNIRGGLLLFDHLLEIRLSYCSKCEKLPTLGHLPSLKVLGIAEMYNVRCIGTEFYGSSNGEGSSNSRGGSGSTVLFPALEKLVLGHMRNLEEWNDVTEPTAELGMIFPRLERLEVRRCEKLTSAPHHFPSLKELDISGVRGPAFEQIISELTTLTSLEIWEISELACLPEHFLQKNRSLMDLRIWNCADLKSILPRGHEWPICTSLRSLHIFRCDELRTLPRALCNLHCLEDIHVEACLNLSSFPSIKGIASSLQRLRLCCSDEVLPPGLQSCMSLQHLYIDHWPHLLSIPDLRNLHSLTVLIIACCPNLISIPDTKEFPSLTCLVIRDCSNLISIPVLKELPSLTRLEISGCPNLISIPDMRELPSLTDLEIRDCQKWTRVPDGLDCLTRLKRLLIGGFFKELNSFPGLDFIQRSHAPVEKLYLYGWASLNSLPEEIQYFTAVKILDISEFGEMDSLPDWLGNLSSLQELHIHNCKKLMYLPTTQAMRRLIKLRIWACPKLKERCAEGSGAEWSKIAHIPEFSSRDLEGNNNDEDVLEGFQPHPNLKSLEIKYFKGEKFPSWLLGSDNIRGGLLLFDHLLEIRLSYCSKCEKLPTLGHLPSLKVLGIAEMYNVRCIGTEFYGSSNGEGSSNSRGGSGSTVLFPALEKLVLGHMRNLEEWNDVTEPTAELGMIFPRLERLQVWGCEKLTSAPHHFPSLKKLFISGIRGPAFEQIISELTTLTSLEIWEISELACLPEHFLQKNRSLMDLRIWNCADLKSILPRGHEWPICTSLRSLHIFRCDELRTLPRALCNLHCLEDIHVEACLNLSSFPSIKGIASSLQRLRLCCSDEVLPPGLQSCMSLQHLYIDHWPHLLSIPDLRNLHSLTVLIIACCPNLISIPDTKEFPSLTCLVIRDCSNLISIPVLKELPSLTRLEISGCPNLISIPDMRELPSLTDLEIRDCSNLISIPVLKELPSLTRLEISGCPNLISIPDMRELPSLTDLEIRDCQKWTRVPDGLDCLTRLKRLLIGGFFKELNSFPGLDFIQRSHAPVEKLYLYGWASLNSLPEEIQYFTAVKILDISEFGEMDSLPDWLGNLSSLQELHIHNCKKLMYLPTTQAMRRLIKLRIWACPKLKERCAEGSGAEWSKIAHIPEFSSRDLVVAQIGPRQMRRNIVKQDKSTGIVSGTHFLAGRIEIYLSTNSCRAIL